MITGSLTTCKTGLTGFSFLILCLRGFFGISVLQLGHSILMG